MPKLNGRPREEGWTRQQLLYRFIKERGGVVRTWQVAAAFNISVHTAEQRICYAVNAGWLTKPDKRTQSYLYKLVPGAQMPVDRRGRVVGSMKAIRQTMPRLDSHPIARVWRG